MRLTLVGPAVLAMACVLSSFIAGTCRGQCAGWKVGPLVPARGTGFASVQWDPDGAGPQAAQLIVGGSFDRAGGPGGTAANNIAAWNGTSWSRLGNGLNRGSPDYPWGGIYALAVYNNELVAAGRLTLADGTAIGNIARWNGSSWRSLNAGIIESSIECMAIYNGELYIGGRFTYAAGRTVNKIARWNGTAWSLVGGGVTGTDAAVLAMQVYNGELIVAGEFEQAGGLPVNNIARWNGSRWAALGSGVDRRVYALHVYASELIVGGTFDEAGAIPAQSVAGWNGARWRVLGGGIDGTVDAFHTYGGELIAGGTFWEVNGEHVGNLAKWNGAAWSRLGANSDVGGAVRSLATFGGSMYAFGSVFQAGPHSVMGVARWNGVWNDVPGLVIDDGVSPNVSSMAVWNGNLVMGGLFTVAEESSQLSHLARWSGRYSEPVLDIRPNGAVLGLLAIPRSNAGDDLVIGGVFTDVGYGSGPINRILMIPGARRDDEPAYSQMGAGFNGGVWALAMFDGQVVAGGDFTASGARGMDRLARYDGAGWQPLGSGLNDGVRALKSYTDRGVKYLAVGGWFTASNGFPAGRIALLTRDPFRPDSWSTMNGGFNGRVDAIERYNGVTIAGGAFTATAGGAPLGSIAQYVGGSWQPLGLGLNGPVRTLFVDGSDLYVGGNFTLAGNIPCNRLARWNGFGWSPVSGGTDAAINVMAKYKDELAVGGAFTQAGPSPALESPLVARYSPTGAPWIGTHPESKLVCRGAYAYFHAAEALGFDPATLTFTWRRNGVVVTSGTTPHGSVIDAEGRWLEIRNAQMQDNGSYTCTVTSSCGSGVSGAARLTVCAVDVNCDGFVDFFDYDEYIGAFESGEPMTIADFNNDGFLDFFDYDAFVEAFEQGC